jgi:pyruvate dehydrogenase E2 component (dihydrolipoamide acetyltransferase)
MAAEVTMPKLTDSMEEGRIVEWKVAPGDTVTEGDVLAEIETDKAVMELESFWDGTVDELLRQADEVVSVGEVIARIRERGVDAAAAQESAGPEKATSAPGSKEQSPEDEEPQSAVPAGSERKGVPPGSGAATARAVSRPPPGMKQADDALPLPGAHPLAERGGKESPRPAPPAKRPGPAAARPESARGAGGETGVRASPRARRLARERGVDLAAVSGTGPNGRITSEDVANAASGDAERPPKALAAGRADEELPAVSFAAGEAEAEEVSFYQKASIRRVVASKHVIPHFYISRTVPVDALLARKAAEKDRSGATLTHLLSMACVRALERHPAANRSYDRGRWIRWKTVNLGLAIQTDAGLVVGVLRDAAGKDLVWLAQRARELVERARQGKLKPEERSNATFTLSNLGAYDVESFSAIINPPSAMTLAIGSALAAPLVKEGRVTVGTVVHLTLSCDHRVIDGALGAEFLREVGRSLEQPEGL